MSITINGTTGIAGVDGSAGTPAVQGTDTNTGVFFGTDTVTIATGGTAAVTVDSGQRTKFPTTIGVGGATPSTSGSGISFPATQSASTDANTLDDYEEGTYTATLTPGSSGSITLNNSYKTLSYTKIGRVVHISGYLSVSSVSSPTGALVELNLPFTVATGDQFQGNATFGFNVLGSSKAANIAVARIGNATTIVRIYDGSINSIGTGVFATYIAANTDVGVSITYFTS